MKVGTLTPVEANTIAALQGQVAIAQGRVEGAFMAFCWARGIEPETAFLKDGEICLKSDTPSPTTDPTST